MKPIDFSEKFKNIKKNMGIIKSEKDLKLKHPELIRYEVHLSKIKNGEILDSFSNLEEILNKFNISKGNLITDDKTGAKLALYLYELTREDQIPKVHIAYCGALEKLQRTGRSNRLVTTHNTTGSFELLTPFGKKIYKHLEICQWCLRTINYKNCETMDKNKVEEIARNFSFQEFLKEYEPSILYRPSYVDSILKNIGKELGNYYTEDWTKISREFRSLKNWRCEKCGKDFSHNKFELHVHHKDGNKRNNNFYNLKVLCRKCHAEEDMHEHMIK